MVIRSFSLISTKPGSVSVRPSTPTSRWKEVNPGAAYWKTKACSFGQRGAPFVISHLWSFTCHFEITVGIRILFIYFIFLQEIIKKEALSMSKNILRVSWSCSDSVSLCRGMLAEMSFPGQLRVLVHESPLWSGSAWGLRPLQDDFKAQSHFKQARESATLCHTHSHTLS